METTVFNESNKKFWKDIYLTYIKYDKKERPSRVLDS